MAIYFGSGDHRPDLVAPGMQSSQIGFVSRYLYELLIPIREIEIPGLDGQRHAIPIPAGIQSGKQLRKRGAGMPVLNGRGMGDMVIEVQVETPTKLTARQKELLREFQASETGEECPQSKGFFDRIKDAWNDLTE